MKTVCAITCHLTPETLFSQISTFVEIRDLTYMEKSLTQDLMRRQDLLFEKATIIFQTS
jgi:hypothetical protein